MSEQQDPQYVYVVLEERYDVESGITDRSIVSVHSDDESALASVRRHEDDYANERAQWRQDRIPVPHHNHYYHEAWEIEDETGYGDDAGSRR